MRKSVEDRFWSKVDKTGTCWWWTACVNKYGYGTFGFRGKVCRAHRVAYLLSVGEIPTGMTIDHLCRNRRCVRPSHMEPVTRRVNTLRGISPSVVTYKTGICKRGHDMYAVGSVRRTGRMGQDTWSCRACHNARGRGEL